MKYRIEYKSDDAIFIITTEGDFIREIFLELTRELLEHENWQPGTSCLFDYRACNFMDLSRDEIDELTGAHHSRNDMIGEGKSVLVMKDRGNFGIGRMYQLMTEDLVDARFLITTEFGKGLEWLKAENA